MFEHTPILELINVRCIVLMFLTADAALAAIAGKIALAIRKLLHGDEAFITAFSAAVGAGLCLKGKELICSKQC